MMTSSSSLSSSSSSGSSSSNSSSSISSLSSDCRTWDPQLVEAIKDELRLKLTNDIDEITSGIIKISLSRYGQCVRVIFDNGAIVLQHTQLPDKTHIEEQCFNLSDPDLDPIKTICRYVDKASRLIATYERNVRYSKSLLGQLL